MIIDEETNKLYLADCLPKSYPEFFKRFEKVLNECNIPFDFLPGTKDIWAVDFMPVQISTDKFIRFKYAPDYLLPKKYHKFISDSEAICKEIKIDAKPSNLIVDGGNVVRSRDKVIMCDKVFYENKSVPEKELICQLEELFEVDKIVFVPWDKNDIIGHADGMVRFIDNNTVLINDLSVEDEDYQRSFRMSLHNAALDWVELPYNPPFDTKSISAKGIYINYLQMKQAIIMPIFGSQYDGEALRVLEEVFKGQTIRTVESNEIAEGGGVLNCITWNIKSKQIDISSKNEQRTNL